MLHGIGVSKGIAIGRIVIYKKPDLKISDNKIDDTASEIVKFEHARESAIAETEELIKKASLEHTGEVEEIMESHKEILTDVSGFVKPVHEAIAQKNINCSFAVHDVLTSSADLLRNLDSQYMRERAADVEDVRDLILAKIQGLSNSFSMTSPGIVAAYDLQPSDTVKLDFSLVEGIITEGGGPTGHTAIMARIMGIPSVVGVKGLMGNMVNGEQVILDGSSGTVITMPSPNEIANYKQVKTKFLQQQEASKNFIGKPTITCDNRILKLMANIGTDKDAGIIVSSDAEGVGLVRTEFLFMQRNTLPGEEEQFSAYKTIMDAVQGRPVVFRTMDAGGDKDLPALGLKKEENPFLGLRAIRISLKYQDIFKTQLRALFRAGKYGDLRIMLPMISSCEEVDKCLDIISIVKRELKDEGTDFRDTIPIGIMIEVPAAAIIAGDLAKRVDFFSIGTNDLTQYLIAADRGNTDVSDLFTTYHPAVLKLIEKIISDAHNNGISCSMCGEAAGDTILISFLIGAGLECFSISPSEILRVRDLISRLSYKRCKELAEKTLACCSATQVKSLLLEFKEEFNENR